MEYKFQDKDGKLWQVFLKEFLGEEGIHSFSSHGIFKRWDKFIQEKDIGIKYNPPDFYLKSDTYYDVYEVTNCKKWTFAKIKYGI